MKQLERSQILDAETYEFQRMEFRLHIKDVKERRRVILGEHMTLLFENHETTRHQVQEALRTHGITDDAEIQRQIDIHNERLGDEDTLGCTLLIQIDGLERRERMLGEWIDLPQHLFLGIEGGRHVAGVFDPRQTLDGRLSSVQYVKFNCGDQRPVIAVCTRPGMEMRVPLADEVCAELAADLGLD